MDEMKECKTCGEEIKAKALKCPHCQTWQTKWKYDPTNPKHHLILILLLLGLMSFMFYNSFGSVFNHKDFEKYKNQVEVKNTNISFSTASCGSKVAVIGTILNKSNISWGDIYFETQFFDKDNKLIDTVSDHDYDLVILKNSESTFKVAGSAAREKSLYDHYKVIIKDAKVMGSIY